MAALPRRIIKETQRLMQEPVPGISAVPDDVNARYFHVVVAGPEVYFTQDKLTLPGSQHKFRKHFKHKFESLGPGLSNSFQHLFDS